MSLRALFIIVIHYCITICSQSIIQFSMASMVWGNFRDTLYILSRSSCLANFFDTSLIILCREYLMRQLYGNARIAIDYLFYDRCTQRHNFFYLFHRNIWKCKKFIGFDRTFIMGDIILFSHREKAAEQF